MKGVQGHLNFSMVTGYVKRMIATCLTTIERLYESIIVASGYLKPEKQQMNQISGGIIHDKAV